MGGPFDHPPPPTLFCFLEDISFYTFELFDAKCTDAEQKQKENSKIQNRKTMPANNIGILVWGDRNQRSPLACKLILYYGDFQSTT